MNSLNYLESSLSLISFNLSGRFVVSHLKIRFLDFDKPDCSVGPEKNIAMPLHTFQRAFLNEGAKIGKLER